MRLSSTEESYSEKGQWPFCSWSTAPSPVLEESTSTMNWLAGSRVMEDRRLGKALFQRPEVTGRTRRNPGVEST